MMEFNKNFAIKVFKPYYHVGLGKWIHSSKELSRELNAQGLVEVGTEDTRKKFKGMTKEEIREIYGAEK